MSTQHLCNLVNLVSSSDGNDIGFEQILLPSLVCILFLTVIAVPVTYFILN